MSRLVFNVMDPPFSAAGDAKRSLTASTGNTLDVVTDPSGPFVLGDVGKDIWVNDPIFALPCLPRTTIINFIDAQHVQVAIPAIRNVANGCMVFGTDDTAKFDAAFAASLAAFTGSICGLIYAPANGYIISHRWYNGASLPASGGVLIGPNVFGDGKGATQLYLPPDLTIPGDGSPIFMAGVGYGAEWRGITIDGCFQAFTTIAGQALVRMAQAQAFKLSDFTIKNAGVSATAFMLQLQGCRQFHADSITTQNAGIVGAGGGMWIDDCSGLLSECFTSNTAQNLLFTGCDERASLTVPLTWKGGGIDEGNTPACALVGSVVAMDGVINFSGIDDPAVAFDVDGTSRLNLSNSRVGRFLGFTGPSRPVNIRAGGVVASLNNVWRGNAAPGTPTKFMVNAGDFIDCGGNSYRRYSADGVFTKATPADCFDGHMPVVNGSYFPFAQVPTT